MSNFRTVVPKRRTQTITVTNYGLYRNDLKTDYNDRCGYCNDIDTWRNIWFEIDHFVPKAHFNVLTINDYSNLVYACRSCNNAKRAKWPTKDEAIHNYNNVGFIDPCDDYYDKQFERLDSGRILPVTELGNYMYNALKLYKPQHEIIWSIDLLDNLINEIEETLKTCTHDDLSGRLLTCYKEFRNYVKKLSSAGF